MSKRSFKEIRKHILKALNDGKEYSFGALERKVNTNWITIRNHCHDLEIFKAVIILNNKVKITNLGRETLKRL